MAGYLKVLDHQGNKIPIGALTGAYEGATTGRRLSTWGLYSSGPNASLFGSLSNLRSRSRQFVRNNPLAESGVESHVANLIGTGIIPRWRIDDPALKQEIQELFADWTEECDAHGLSDFYGQQALGSHAMVQDGEVLVRFRPRYPGDMLTVPLQIQLIEADHLDPSYESVAPNGNPIRMGIEFDKNIWRRTAYWLFRDHPGEQFIGANTTERVRVPAEEILHMFRPIRPGQQRGSPWLTSIILKLHELDKYEDAELVRKKTAAMFAGFMVERPSESPNTSPLGRRDDRDDQGNEVISLEPGTISLLPGGIEDIKFSTPVDVGQTYEVWIRQQLREIAAGMGVTYEQLTGDLSGVSYSSIRAGLLEFRRRCEMLQWHTIIFQFCQPIARRWLDTAFASGLLNLPAYMANRRKYYRIDWRPQRWPWVDPLKDAMAALIELRAGIRSRSSVIGEMGEDAEDVDRQIAEDAARADELGLVFDSDPRKTQKSGALQSAQDTIVKETVQNA